MTELSRYASGKLDQSVVRVWLDESAAMHDYVKAIMDSYGYDCYFEADTGEAEEGTDYYHAPTQHNTMRGRTVSGRIRRGTSCLWITLRKRAIMSILNMR